MARSWFRERKIPSLIRMLMTGLLILIGAIIWQFAEEDFPDMRCQSKE